MDTLVYFFQTLFSFAIIIPSELFCFLPLKNQLRYPVSKIIIAFLCSFLVIGSLSAVAMMLFHIDNLNLVLFPDLIIFYFFLKSVTNVGTARCLFVFISVQTRR